MLLSDNIDIEDSEKYTLSIRITPAEFAFYIYETDTKELLTYNVIPFSLETNELNGIQQIIFDSDFLTYPYAQTNVIYVSKDYDLTPQYLIRNDKKEALYNFTHSSPAKQILYCSDIIQQVTTIFNVDEEIYKFLARNLYNPQFYHHSNIIMLHLEKMNKNLGNTPKMYINFHDEFIDIFCYNHSSQILHTLTFKGENERSMVYHILNIWDKCGFDQNTTPLYILDGYSIPNMYITSKLREYIKDISSLAVSQSMNTITKDELEVSLPLDLLILNNR